MLNRTRAIRILWITALITPLSSCQPLQTPEQASADAVTSRAATQPYPVTVTVTQVDTYHGTQVADPYRWLEDDVRENPEVRAWADAQQAVTRSYLDTLPARPRFMQSLTQLWNYERESVPEKAGAVYFFSYNDGLQNQDQVRVRERINGPARVLLDPNRWSQDGTMALAGYYPSPDGRYLAYLIQEDGSDWRRAAVLEVASGVVMEDELRWLKFTNLSWRADSSGFYYSRYPEPEAGQAFQSLNRNHAVYWHRLGARQSEDQLVVGDPQRPDWGYNAVVTHDDRWLVTQVRIGTADRNQVLVQDLHANTAPRFLITGFDNEYSFVAYINGEFYFKTDLDAPLGRVVAINAQSSALREVVAESTFALESVAALGQRLLLGYLQDASTVLRLVDYQGTPLVGVQLPTLGSANSFSGKPGEDEAFFSFSSFAQPAQVLRLQLDTGQTTVVSSPDVGMNPNDYSVSQHFAESADGTQVPYFVLHKRGLSLDGRNPTILYGYGGFAISMTPQYSTPRIAWLQAGGVYVVANLRGGNEYGSAWHMAGTKLHKQNVFDDCKAVAESLIAKGYTSADHLALMGGSNGGLLVGAVINQRPALFKAALPMVGVMDMLRFHRFTAGRFWVDDYGSADDPAEFAALYAYSPYHNIKLGQRYPATMVITADTDDRVVPGHSFKYAARLQAAADPAAPVLLYVESNAGHGAGTPTEKLIRRYADCWAFLWAQLAN